MEEIRLSWLFAFELLVVSEDVDEDEEDRVVVGDR